MKQILFQQSLTQLVKLVITIHLLDFIIMQLRQIMLNMSLFLAPLKSSFNISIDSFSFHNSSMELRTKVVYYNIESIKGGNRLLAKTELFQIPVFCIFINTVPFLCFLCLLEGKERGVGYNKVKISFVVKLSIFGTYISLIDCETKSFD